MALYHRLINLQRHVSSMLVLSGSRAWTSVGALGFRTGFTSIKCFKSHPKFDFFENSTGVNIIHKQVVGYISIELSGRKINIGFYYGEFGNAWYLRTFPHQIIQTDSDF